MINRFSKDISNCDGPLNYYMYDCLIYNGDLWGAIIFQLSVIPWVAIEIPIYLVIQLLLFYYVSLITSKIMKKEYLSNLPYYHV